MIKKIRINFFFINDSHEDLNLIKKDINVSIETHIPIVIVANKSDLKEDVEINEEMLTFISKKYGFHYITT